MTTTQLLLIIHLLAISAAYGIVLANIVGFRVAKSVGADMAKGIAAQREALLPYGDVLFVTIIASGVSLLWAIGGAGGLNGWFHAKMAIVVVWVAVYGAMRLRIRKFLASRDATLVPMIRQLAHVQLAAVTIAIICAVMAFAA